MVERRGPEYVRPEVWQAAQAKRQRRIRLAMVPVVLLVVGVTLVALLMPQRVARKALDEMLAAARAESSFHAIERRAGDQAGILREEYVFAESRRALMFDGEVEMIFGVRGSAWAYERSPGVRRRHLGSIVSVDVVERLIQDCESAASVRIVEAGRLEVETRDKKFEITLDSKKRPLAWQTSYRNEVGFQPLWETTVEYVAVTPSSFEPSTRFERTVDHTDPTAPVFTQESTLDSIGDVELTAIDVNRLGDLSLVLSSRYERPFVEVIDSKGHRLSPETLQSTLWRDRQRYRADIVAYRLQREAVEWPLSLTVRVRNYDPRYKVPGFPNRLVGEKTFRFERPTCSIAPPYRFSRVMSDQPYFEALASRSYRLATVFQNAMRDRDGQLVDTMTGGAVGLSEANLVKSPMDTVRAIEELRQVLRLRAEFDTGTIALAQLYVQLASLYRDAGYKDQAKAAIAFVQSRTRYARIEPTLLAEMERLSKELEE